MANARPRTSWGDAVARIDVAEHRSSRRIRRSLMAWAYLVDEDGHDRLNPVERRRRAGLALVDAVAAYRLAGGTLEHFLRVVALTHVHVHDDDATGCVGDRARVARARLELALRHVDDAHRFEHDSHVADVEQRAAALERPEQRTAPGELIVRDVDAAFAADVDALDVTTPAEHAAAHDHAGRPDPVRDQLTGDG